ACTGDIQVPGFFDDPARDLAAALQDEDVGEETGRQQEKDPEDSHLAPQTYTGSRRRRYSLAQFDVRAGSTFRKIDRRSPIHDGAKNVQVGFCRDPTVCRSEE